MTFLKKTFVSFLFLVSLTATLCLMVSEAEATVGFQAELSSLPNNVSNYYELSNQFSVALQPKTRFSLFRRAFPYQLKLVSSSFKNNSLLFTTAYPKRDSLIPVSVDVENYHRYRTAKIERERFDANFRKAFIKASKGDKRQGMNFGVALPKRFNEIFGEGGGNLRVSGHRRISFAGRSQWTDANSESANQSKFPALTMEQNYRLEITGTIGSKVTVKVSQDSRSQVPLENRIQIRYKGDEDDILKSVEAGNTNLSLPRSKFVGYSSRIQGLFGVKAEAQVGRLSLTVIASQEKGSAEKARISAAGGQEGADYRRDNQYEDGRIFDIGPDPSVMAQVEGKYFPHWESEEFVMFNPGDSVKKIEIYESERDEKNPDAIKCNLYIDPRDTTYKPLSGGKDINMILLDQSLYTVYEEAEKNSHYILFNSPRYSVNALGMYLVIARASGVEDTIGSVDNRDSTGMVVPILMTLRSTQVNADPDHEPWWYVWRNLYRIPKNTPADELKISIRKGKANTEETGDNLTYQEVDKASQGEFVKILGLDQFDIQGNRNPDGLVDDRLDVFRGDLGLLIFPNRFPFNSTVTFEDGEDQTPELAIKVPGIYNSKSLSEKVESSEYYVQIATTTRSRDHNLRANIIEGSERVTLNGQLLKKDQDYTIQYDFGRLTLLKEEALDPNSELEIEFEYAPFTAGAMQKKTLLGMRAEYEWSRDLKFGSTVLYKSDKQADRKPKVGMETAEMTIYDFDVAFTLRPDFITKAVDALPLVTTEAPSAINVVAEVAQSYPNPNVDNVAYIDDFEASHEQISFGTSRARWRKASKPGQLDSDTIQRGNLLWHELRTPISIADAYNRDESDVLGNFRPFRMIFTPDPYARDTLGAVPDSSDRVSSWAGITRFFSNRIDESRAQIIELRVKGNSGILHLDFGRISEDLGGDGIEITEDINDNGYVEDYEDVGLDGLIDSLEPGYDADTLPDPSGDNYYFDGVGKCPLPDSLCAQLAQSQLANDESVYYKYLNGTEGNITDLPFLGRPDRERLSSQGFNRTNSYFSYVIDLADTDCMTSFLECGSYDSNDSWKTYRIPIGDPDLVNEQYSESGDLASWDDVTHVRIWFSDNKYANPDESHELQVASWHIVQSNWQDSLFKKDPQFSNTSFLVASVSSDDSTFWPPEGVDAHTSSTTGITEAHRGLALIYDSLHYGDTCLAEKNLLAVEKYAGYRTLEMFVHGDEDRINDSVNFSFRFGRDSETFYEYSTGVRVYSGWNDSNHVKVNFDELTRLKDSLQQNLPEDRTFASIDTTVGNYRIKGDPNLNEISYFAAVVANPDPDRQDVSGRIWLDELRVTDVRRDVGTAARVSASGNLADLISYSFGFEHKDAFFRGISTATRGGGNNSLGSGKTQQSFNWSTTLSVHKLFPRSLGMTLPVSLSYSKSTTTPLLRTRSDIVLPEETREKEKTVTESRSFRVSESFRHKGENLLFDLFLNRQKLAFSYSQSNTTSPVRPYSMGENYNFTGEYDLSWKSSPRLPIFFFLKSIPIFKIASASTLGIYPTSWNFSGKFTRSLSLSDDINRKRTSSLKRDLQGEMRLKYDLFQNLPITFGFSTKRDLSNPELVNFSLNPSQIKLGLETSYRQNFSFKYDPGLLNWLTTKYGFSSNYNETLDRATSSLKSDLNQSWDLSGSFQHQALLGGKSTKAATGRRGGTPRRDVRGGGVTEEKSKKRFYDPALSVLRFMTSWANPIGYKYSKSYRASLPGMLTRPSWGYRLGLTRIPSVDIVSDRRPSSSSESKAYEVSSGFKLLGGIITTVKFRRSIATDLVRQGTRYEKTSTAWPSLTIRIQRFTKFPLIKDQLNKFIEIFAPKTSYSRDTKEDYNLTDGFVTNKNESIAHSPLLAINFKLFDALSFTGSYNLTKNMSTKFHSTTGELQSETQSENRRISFSAAYSFSAPGGISIPLFGKLKFKSKVDINLRVNRNASTSEKKETGGGWVPYEDKSDFSVNPTIGYAFSSKVKGGLTGRWQDSSDNMSHRNNHVREIQLWAEIRF